MFIPIHWWAALVAGVWSLDSAAVEGRSQSPSHQELLRMEAEVRIQARGLRRGWNEGVVGEVGPCRVVLVPTEWNGTRATAYKPVAIDSLTAVQVRPARGPAGTRAGGVDAGWRDLSVAAVRRAHGGCRAW